MYEYAIKLPSITVHYVVGTPYLVVNGLPARQDFVCTLLFRSPPRLPAAGRIPPIAPILPLLPKVQNT